MKRNKPLLTTSVSPLTEKQLDVLVGSHHLFSSRSDAVEKAIGMLFCALNSKNLCENAEQYGISLHGNMAGTAVEA
ncbi:hypothetical protein [Methanolobus sp.]|jgi:hypothetical protein|uniref:hypothetical protein n=1 Tax=Methanolobus sp. TaxID=1874737 RepID=UPI0025FDFF61|nr:hypothetical protein [Methanolobus sp.]